MEAEDSDRKTLNAAELGAVSQLFRAEITRSTAWRTRLDTTTNWAVVTLGVALSISFSSPNASPLPLGLVGVLIIFFLMLEARRYRYFNVWRARARWLETHFIAPLLYDGDLHMEDNWQRVLAHDYISPRYHVSFMVALGRRLRRSYIWILIIQAIAMVGKLVAHPEPASSLSEAMNRAAHGPVSGEVLVVLGVIYIAIWVGIAVWSHFHDRNRSRVRGKSSSESMG